MPRYAVFFRNLNLGRPPAPDRAQLEAAFAEAGADAPQSFQVNGNLVFGARSATAAQRVLKAARNTLKAANGFEEPAFLRSLDALRALAATEPFADVDPDAVYERCVTFLDPDAELPDLSLSTTRGDVRLLSHGPAEVFSVSLKLGKSPGSPNLLLEKTTGRPATTRAWGTIERLLAKHG